MKQSKCYDSICAVLALNKPILLENNDFCEWLKYVSGVIDEMMKNQEIDTVQCNTQSNGIDIILECDYTIPFDNGLSHPFFLSLVNLMNFLSYVVDGIA